MKNFLKILRSTHDRLVSNLDHKERGQGPLINQLPIIQAFGSGKSRLVYEVGKTIFTISVCLRQDNESGSPFPS